MAAQKVKVLELNRARDELGVLLKDVESAQRAFDNASSASRRPRSRPVRAVRHLDPESGHGAARTVVAAQCCSIA
jgi:hypothetical protein